MRDTLGKGPHWRNAVTVGTWLAALPLTLPRSLSCWLWGCFSPLYAPASSAQPQAPGPQHQSQLALDQTSRTMSQNKPLCLLYVCVTTMRNDWQVRGGGPAPVRESNAELQREEETQGKRGLGQQSGPSVTRVPTPAFAAALNPGHWGHAKNHCGSLKPVPWWLLLDANTSVVILSVLSLRPPKQEAHIWALCQSYKSKTRRPANRERPLLHVTARADFCFPVARRGATQLHSALVPCWTASPQAQSNRADIKRSLQSWVQGNVSSSFFNYLRGFVRNNRKRPNMLCLKHLRGNKPVPEAKCPSFL